MPTNLPQQIPYNQYVADGITTTYNYNFLILEAISFTQSDISVYVTLPGALPAPLTDIQVLNTAYTVTGVGVTTGGTIIFQPGYVPPASSIITIVRSMNFSISTNFSVAQNFNGANLDAAFERVVLQMQQLYADFVFTALQYPIDAYLPSRTSNILPILTTQNNQVWMSNNGQIVAALLSGNPTIQSGTINAGLGGQVAFYAGNGNKLSGTFSPTLLRINDTTYNLPVIGFSNPLNAVNYFSISGSVTGNDIVLRASGTDTNITMLLESAGTGGVLIQGLSNGNNPSTGFTGELLSQVVTFASPLSITGGSTPYNLAMITLTPGNWDVRGNFGVSSTTVTNIEGGISLTSLTLPNPENLTYISPLATSVACSTSVPSIPISVTVNTNIYLVVAMTGTGSPVAYGGLYARRI